MNNHNNSNQNYQAQWNQKGNGEGIQWMCLSSSAFNQASVHSEFCWTRGLTRNKFRALDLTVPSVRSGRLPWPTNRYPLGRWCCSPTPFNRIFSGLFDFSSLLRFWWPFGTFENYDYVTGWWGPLATLCFWGDQHDDDHSIWHRFTYSPQKSKLGRCPLFFRGWMSLLNKFFSSSKSLIPLLFLFFCLGYLIITKLFLLFRQRETENPSSKRSIIMGSAQKLFVPE